MDFLTDNQIIFVTSKKYEDIYIKLRDLIEIKYHELFILCASIGFKHNKSEPVRDKGRELRSTYFDQSQKASAYTIILSDPELGMDIEKFSDEAFISTAKKVLEGYAEGGMELLIKQAFPNKFNEDMLDPRYEEYLLDILSYIYSEIQEIPF